MEMMSPVKGVDGVGAVCYDPVDREEAEMKKEDCLLGQAWEKTALQSITQQSGLFNSKYNETCYC